MATNMTEHEIYEALRSPETIRAKGFDILRNISGLLADPEHEMHAHDMLLRALEHKKHFSSLTEVLNSLVRSAGLFPYLERELLDSREAMAYEFHRPENMEDDLIFHREQADVYRRLLAGDNVILSAPTSFGKSKIIDAIISKDIHKNIAIIVPTLALIDETRRRLAAIAKNYKLITHVSQIPANKNIFVFTAERTVAYDKFPKIDFFVIDEFYKLGAMKSDEERTVSLNQAFYKLKKHGGQFYLLGPNIRQIPDGFERAFRCYFYPTKFTTVASDVETVTPGDNDVTRLVDLCKKITDPTIIFCKSPSRVNIVAHALLDAGLNAGTNALSSASDWIARNYHPDWVLPKSILQGIGIHHGRLPRSIAQYIVRMFNELRLKYLVCTSTLIEGVNTKAKNIIIFDNQIARDKIDYFTFNNIKGRSGRMFEHFIGHVYLFYPPPEAELPFVDFPIYTQEANAPDTLLLQMEDNDLKSNSKKRLLPYQEQDLLPMSVLRENAAINPMAQLSVAKHLAQKPSHWSRLLAWSRYPSKEQLKVACDLIWTYFVDATRSHGGVRSGKQLAFKIQQMQHIKSLSRRILKELTPGNYAAQNADDAVERVLEFERTWAGFEMPKYLMGLCRIQKAILEKYNYPYGDYTYYASQIECYFKNPVASALDEYGIPIQIGERITRLIGEEQDLDNALGLLKDMDFDKVSLHPFELELLEDAIGAMTPR